MAHSEFYEELKERFGHRYKEHPDRGQEADGPTSLVIPADVEEVKFLAKLAGKYAVPLVPEGAGTAPELRRPP